MRSVTWKKLNAEAKKQYIKSTLAAIHVPRPPEKKQIHTCSFCNKTGHMKTKCPIYLKALEEYNDT